MKHLLSTDKKNPTTRAPGPSLTRMAAEETLDMNRTHLSSSFERHPKGTSKTPLPNELIIQVLSHLAKHELKTTRLVSKTWSYLASEPLFDKLYISPREEDIRVFKLVTQHPQLRRCVTTLEYDATRFAPDISISTYVRRLLDCTPLDYSGDMMTMHKIRKRENLDPQIDEYLNVCMTCQDRMHVSLAFEEEKFKDFDFVIDGWRSWQECATYQEKYVNSGDFLRIMVCGLRSLNRLNSVLVCQEWDIWRYDPFKSHYYNSPFGRTWHIFRAQPLYWKYDGTPKHGFENFWVLTTALAAAQTRLRHFATRSLPSIVFDTVEHAKESMVECSIDAFSGLESLSLTLRYDAWRGETRKLSGLQSLLRSMTGLKILNLCLSEKNTRPEFTLEQILPTTEVHWMKLSSLELESVSTPAKDLVQLLAVRMSKLQVLHLLAIQLVEGSWEGVIESMKNSMHLQDFSLLVCWVSPHLGRCRLNRSGKWKRALKDGGDVCNSDVEEYVLRGGRHPFLHPDEPDSASEKYLSAPWL